MPCRALIAILCTLPGIPFMDSFRVVASREPSAVPPLPEKDAVRRSAREHQEAIWKAELRFFC
jgi:hypothetical protein